MKLPILIIVMATALAQQTGAPAPIEDKEARQVANFYLDLQREQNLQLQMLLELQNSSKRQADTQNKLDAMVAALKKKYKAPPGWELSQSGNWVGTAVQQPKK